MLIKLFLLSNLFEIIFSLSTNVTINGLGTVIGIEEYTKWSNRTIYSFRGIPYAQPPIGDLRFAPPVNITTWNETLYAQEYGNVCPQSGDLGTLSYSEDCLTLNVHVPRVNNESELLPVMIWIHGGTFMAGYASAFRPNLLLEENVILVVIQFRLGPLGLLCLQTDEIPGNVQFLDQIMAMKWVRDNIGYFGGDPNQVTLFGQSSGGASVNLHQFSPLSRGLFHRVIIQSGSASAPWVIDYNPFQTATRLGSLIGCTETNATLLATCYKNLDVQTLLNGYDVYLIRYNLEGLSGLGGNKAVLQTAGAERFLEEDPSILLSRSEYTKVPMIGGVTKHDGSFVLAEYYYAYFYPYGLTNDTEYLQYDLIPFITGAFGTNDPSGVISQLLINTHFEEDQIGNFTAMTPGIIDICSVFAFKSGVFRMLQANSRSNISSYLYSFGYFGVNEVAADDADLAVPLGVGHSAELLYLFSTNDLQDDDLIVAKKMVSLWTSFAIDGRPVYEDNEHWQPMNTAFGPYLIIENEFHNADNFLTEHTIALNEGMSPVPRSSASTYSTPFKSILIIMNLYFYVNR